MNILADYPAFMVTSLPEGHDIPLTEDKGYCRTSPIVLRIAGFKNEKSGHEYLSGFAIGADDKSGVWAYGRGSMLTAERRAKEYHFGASIGDTIRIEGVDYIIREAANKNIKFEEVA